MANSSKTAWRRAMGLLAAVVLTACSSGCGGPLKWSPGGILLWPVAQKRLGQKSFSVRVERPQWTHDSKSIIFQRSATLSRLYLIRMALLGLGGAGGERQDTSTEEIMIYDVAERQLRHLADGRNPRASPIGPYVVHFEEATAEHPRLWRLLNIRTNAEMDLGHVEKVYNDGWSPRMSYFVYDSGTELRIIDASAMKAVALPEETDQFLHRKWNERTEEGLLSKSALWSAKGNVLYIYIMAPGGRHLMYAAVEFPSGQMSLLDKEPGKDERYRPPHSPPARSPDGTMTLKVTKQERKSEKRGVVESVSIENLFLVRPDGTEEQLTDFPEELPKTGKRKVSTSSRGGP